MKVRILGAILAAAAAFPVVAVEPGKAYAGVMISKVSYDASITFEGDSYDVEAEPEAFIIRVGYQLSEYASVEARYGAGTSDDALTIDDDDSNADAGLDTYYGAFIRVHLPNKTAVSPYFIAGYNKIEMEIEGGSASSDDDDTDLATGLGADFAIGSAFLTLEYLQIYDKNNVSGDTLSLGLATTF